MHMAPFVVGTIPGGCDGASCSLHGTVPPRFGLLTVNGEGESHHRGGGRIAIPNAGHRSDSSNDVPPPRLSNATKTASAEPGLIRLDLRAFQAFVLRLRPSVPHKL
jgi:hypothetical protein